MIASEIAAQRKPSHVDRHPPRAAIVSMPRRRRHDGLAKAVVNVLLDGRRSTPLGPRRGKIVLDPVDLEAYRASCRVVGEPEPKEERRPRMKLNYFRLA